MITREKLILSLCDRLGAFCSFMSEYDFSVWDKMCERNLQISLDNTIASNKNTIQVMVNLFGWYCNKDYSNRASYLINEAKHLQAIVEECLDALNGDKIALDSISFSC